MLVPCAGFILIGLSSVRTIVKLRKQAALHLGLAAVVCLTTGIADAQTKAATTTTLSITSKGAAVTTVAPGSAVTLTATVRAGANPVTAGQVNFCDASATSCTDIHLVGVAAVTSNGTAIFRFVPGAGAKTYNAEFVADAADAASSSAISNLTVSPAKSIVYSDLTTLSSTGFPGDYSLTATVVGFGGTAPPTGNISFVDTSFGNNTLATAPLGASVAGQGWLMSQTTPLTVSQLPEVAGDFNGDGIPDLAVPTPTAQNTANVTILMGNGDGSFTTGPVTAVDAPAQDTLVTMIAGDFNGDGKADLAFLYSSGGTTDGIVVLLGNNDGTFSQSQPSQFANNGSPNGGDFIDGAMVAGDFNGDGKLDVAIVGAYVSTGGVAIVLGNGDGTFQTVATSFATTQGFNVVATGDFNGDGVPDLVASAYFSPGESTILLGKGDGTFTALATLLPTDNFVSSIVTGDFNGDGHLDLAFGYGTGPAEVMVFLGEGDGTFDPAPGSPVMTGSGLRLVGGDFNHDGKLDLAAIDDYDAQIDVFMGGGDGTFREAVTSPGLNQNDFSYPNIVAADFNGDGQTDLAFASQSQTTTSILLAEPTQTATATVTGIAPTGAATHNVEASFPGDGNYPAGVSAPVALAPGLAPLVITPAAGLYNSPQTITITESVPGATIYYLASGPLTTPGNNYAVYTGPIVINEGGEQLIQAYAAETGYTQSNPSRLIYTINLPVAPSPSISLAPGRYSTSQTVTISDSIPGATIYYTTNGSQPTVPSPIYTGPATPTQIYTGPIAVNSSETLVATAVAPEYSMSAPATAQYLIGNSSIPLIYTIAGNGTPGWTGDGGPATLADLSNPGATALDGAGNLYIADVENHRIRKVAAGTHIITTVAGNGVPGYSGDNGAATSAQLNDPSGVAVDSAGNIYISDTSNNVIRKVTATTGIITTVAGNGVPGYSGDGGLATSAEISSPWELAVDSAGNVYFADETHVIRKVTASTGIITTVAGGSQNYSSSGDNGPATSALLISPVGLALDSAGNIYIADWVGNVIRKVTAATGVITTVAGTEGSQQGYYPAGYAGDGGPATSALLDQPSSVAVDSAGNLYIADTGNQVVRKVTASTGIITTIAGNDSICFASTGDGGAALNARLCASGPPAAGEGASLSGISIDGAGNLYISDNTSNRIREITTSAVPPTTPAAIPAFSISPGSYPNPQTITITDSTPGASIYVSLTGATANTDSPGYNGPIAATGTVTIEAVAVAPGYVVSSPVTGTYTIGTPPTAVISTIAGNGNLGEPGAAGPATSADFGTGLGMARNKAGDLYFGDITNDEVWKLSASTNQLSLFAGTGTQSYSGDGGPATAADLNYPASVAVDSAGNVYIADEDNAIIRKVDANTGVITTFAGTYNQPSGTTSQNIGDGGPATAAHMSPSDLAFDGEDNLYVVDADHAVIRKISAATGIITTVAGVLATNSYGGYSGDGGPATSAQLANPRRIALDSSGNFYFSDQSSTRIREVVAATGIIKTIAGNGSYGISGDGGAATAASLSVQGLAVDGTGALYVSSYGPEIRKIDPATGIISRYVGNSYPGFFGDGGLPTLAEISVPEGLLFDPAGSLYFVDSSNYRIRKVAFLSPAATPAFSPAGGAYSGSQSVTITDATSGANIYYSTDGSTPTPASNLYGGPIAVSSTETLKAIATATGFKQSAEASATYTISQRTAPVITWATPAPIHYGVPLSATQLDAAAGVAGTFIYSPPAGTVLDAGEQTLSVTFTPTDTTHYTTSAASVMLTVDMATVALSAVSSSANPSLVSNPVTFTATVTATAGTPGGSIAFFDGSTQLGSAPLSAGTASFTTSALAAGSHTITAVYSGDANFASVTSAVLTQIVQNFSIGTASGQSSSATVAAGGHATFALTVTPPASGAPVTFAITGLPSGATASFAPSSVPAGSGPTNVTLTITAPASAEVRQVTSPFDHPDLPVLLGLLLLPFAGRLRHKSQRWLGLIVLGVAGIAATTMIGCGGGSAGGGGGATPPPASHTYTLTVTAMSGSFTESTALTLTVN